MKKRINRFIIACLVLTLTIGMTACGKEAKIEKQLTLGQASIEAGNYVAAIAAYEEAINLDKYEIAGYEGLVKAMVGDERSGEEIKVVVQEVSEVLAELKESETGIPEEKKAEAENFYVHASTAFSGNADEELEILKNGVGILGEDSQLADIYETKIENLVYHYMEENNFEKAKQYIGLLGTALPSNLKIEKLESTVNEKEKAVAEAEAEQVVVDIMMTAYSYIESQNWQALAELYGSEKKDIIEETIGIDESHGEGSYVHIFDGGNTGYGIGIHFLAVYMGGDVAAEWYVGEYVDGIRWGKGCAYSVTYDDGKLIISTIEGTWKDKEAHGNVHAYLECDGQVLIDQYTYIE